MHQPIIRQLASVVTLSLLLFTSMGCEFLESVRSGDIWDDDSQGSWLDWGDDEVVDATTSTGDGLPLGSLCSTSSECDGDDLCLPYTTESRCSAKCDPDTEVFCSDGAFCVGLKNVDYGACASYGSGAEATECEGRTDCMKQMTCVYVDGVAVCNYACNYDKDGPGQCPSGRDCQISTAPVDYGICAGGPWYQP